MIEEIKITGDAFYKFLADKKLMGSRCKKCHALYLPPHPICRKCYSDDMEWVELRGSGEIVAFTAVSVGTSSTTAEGYSRNNPYVVGIVKMDEGPRISGRIQGIDPKNPDKIKLGRRVSLQFPESVLGARRYLVFHAF